MYHGSGDPRRAQPARERLAAFSPEERTRLLLSRVRKLLDAYTPGMPCDFGQAVEILAEPLDDPALERERLFVLGWLHWLHGEPSAAEPVLVQAVERARESKAAEALAEVAYWLARLRLQQGCGEALTEFEGVLRTLGGSPRATAWFVDLLGRAGRVERAEQVWKSVRGNRRVAGCPEGPLLEARLLLRRGELSPADQLLAEATPASGVVWVEQLLLRAWIAASQKQAERARDLLRQATEGPYPATALRTWMARVEQRLGGAAAGDTPAAWRDFLNGQQARREGRDEEASAAYRAALANAVAQPFARYGLVCLGQEEAAALLASQPGLFLAVRCRARLGGERFRCREINPVEYLDALQQAAVLGYQDTAADHFRRLADALQQRQPTADAVRELAASSAASAAGRNCFRAALELAARRLPLADARALLLEWAKREDVGEELRTLLGRQLLRLLLIGGSDAEMNATVDRLLPDEPLRILVEDKDDAKYANLPPAVRLWRAAQGIDPQEVRQLRALPCWRGLAQALLLHEAAQRGDVAAALALLEEIDFWRGLRAPPRFVLQALEYLVMVQPHHAGWRRGLARWLPLWEPAALGSEGRMLAVHAGLREVRADSDEPPPGVPDVPWLLHQASRALARDDARESLAFTRRALARDPELTTVPEARIVRAALPEMERQAQAQELAEIVAEKDRPPAGVLADAVAALAERPEGAAVLDALSSGDRAAARARLDALSEQPDLSPRLAHHLALLMQRSATACAEREDTASAEAYGRRAWLCWLQFLRAGQGTDVTEIRRIVLDFLLEQHRHRINDLLARNAIDAARRHANLVRELPARADDIEETLGRDLAERAERFHEELATEYLLTTREAMRYGAIPEGWRADYEKGLTYLRRLLSLDRDNSRLLAALVEICNDWFLDLYHQNDPAALRVQVERFTPFALQLARRIAERPGDLSARAALADFWKFRGFLAGERPQKIALYREALRFNPANTNVRDLLAELEPPVLHEENEADGSQSV